MIIEEVSIDKITPYENNPRDNSESVGNVYNSIEEFDYLQPIVVDKNYVIIAGHTRYQALKRLGEKTIQVVVARHLNEQQVKAYRLADNKSAESSKWVQDMLDKELAEISDIDMSQFGFDDDEISSYIDDTDTPIEDDDYRSSLDDVPERVKKGDIWILGKNRLMCGDSTSSSDMSKLMNCEVADITFTSPPYNTGNLDVTIDGKVDKNTQQKYLNDVDTRDETEYIDFLDNNVKILLNCSKTVFYNMGVVSGSKRAIIELLHRNIDYFKDFVYWEKTNPTPIIVKSAISSAIELIMAFGKNNTRSFGKELGYFTGVINGSTASENQYADVHKATFPLYLPYEMIKTFTDEGQKVLDCFGGTGTTMIACEQLKRQCYMMELEPRYCDIIIDRWEKYTGEKAHIETNATP